MNREQILGKIINKVLDSNLPAGEKMLLAYGAIDTYELNLPLKFNYWEQRITTQEELWQKHKARQQS